MLDRLKYTVIRLRDYVRFNSMELDWLDADEVVRFDAVGAAGEGRFKNWARITLTDKRLVLKSPAYGPNWVRLDDTGFIIPVDRLIFVSANRRGFQVSGSGGHDEVIVANRSDGEYRFWLPDSTELVGLLHSLPHS